MTKYLVYPEDYDAAIASGPPPEGYLKFGCSWTEEETKHHQELMKKAVIMEMDEPPKNRYFMEIEE